MDVIINSFISVPFCRGVGRFPPVANPHAEAAQFGQPSPGLEGTRRLCRGRRQRVPVFPGKGQKVYEASFSIVDQRQGMSKIFQEMRSRRFCSGRI